MNEQTQNKRTSRYDIYFKSNGKCALCGKDLYINEMYISNINKIDETSNNSSIDEDEHIGVCKNCHRLKKNMSVEEYRGFVSSELKNKLLENSFAKTALDYNLISLNKLEKITFYYESLLSFTTIDEMQAFMQENNIKKIDIQSFDNVFVAKENDANYTPYHFNNEKTYFALIADINNKVVKEKNTKIHPVQKAVINGMTFVIIASVCTESGLPAITITNYRK